MRHKVSAFLLYTLNQLYSDLRIRKNLIAFLSFLFLSVIVSAAGDDWRGWRGLDKQACSDSSGPVRWSSAENVLWKVHIDGEGFSSPVVSDKEVFVTAAHAEYVSHKMNYILFAILTSIVIFLIIRNQYFLINSIVRSRMSADNSQIFKLYVLIIYGFWIFGYAVVCWMYFNEGRSEGEEMLINYMFSGALLLFSVLLSSLKLPEHSALRILIGILVILLAVMLLKFRPNPDFFLIPDFFKVQNIWLFQLTVPSIILPVVLSMQLILKTLISVRTRQIFYNYSIQTQIEKLYSISPRLSLYSALLLGLSGFIAIPVISACKWLFRNDLARIQSHWNLFLFFDPGFAYPLFLGIITVGFLMWFFLSKKKDGFGATERTGLFPVLIVFSALFFILLNYWKQDPSFSRDILCFDRHSGKRKWVSHALTGKPIECSNYNSQASPTPLIDSNSVYSYFGSAGLISTDKSGNIRWKNTSLPFKSIHGSGASPIFRKGGIIVLSSMSENPYLVSLDNKTGQEQWKTDLPAITGVGGEYRTPLLYESGGRELIIEWSTSRSQIVIYDAKTGLTISQYNTEWADREEAIATPSIDEDILYLSDRKSVVALDIFKLLNNLPPIIWKTDLNGRGPGTSSPVLSHGLLFMISDNGFASCLDSKTGVVLWQNRLKGIYFSSPVSMGKYLYYSNTAGITTVLESGRKYVKIAENSLPEGIYSTLVPVDGQLFIRTKNTLWCIK